MRKLFVAVLPLALSGGTSAATLADAAKEAGCVNSPTLIAGDTYRCAANDGIFRYFNLSGARGPHVPSKNKSLVDAEAAYRRGDFAMALRLLRPLADRGNADAQYTLGYMYAYGQGVRQDWAAAARWLRLAADQSNSRAQSFVGLMFESGLGVSKDYAEAFRWYRKAANAGEPIGQARLADMYEEGKGVAQEKAEAVRWRQRAAEQGVAEAQRHLAANYYAGDVVPKDYSEAARWAHLAAVQGDALAQLMLGRMYAAGQGVPQDFAEALKWSNLAISNMPPEQALLRDEEIKHRDALKQQANLVFLSCVVESPSDLRGVELQYRIDMQNNWAFASKGPGPPTNVAITDSEITFKQEQQRVSISRMSGAYIVTTPNGLLATGRCNKTTSQKF